MDTSADALSEAVGHLHIGARISYAHNTSAELQAARLADVAQQEHDEASANTTTTEHQTHSAPALELLTLTGHRYQQTDDVSECLLSLQMSCLAAGVPPPAVNSQFDNEAARHYYHQQNHSTPHQQPRRQGCIRTCL